MMLAYMLYEKPLCMLPGGRRLWVTDAAIVCESVNGGWYAARPCGKRWGLNPPQVDQMPTAQQALQALEVYDAILVRMKMDQQAYDRKKAN